MKITYFLSAFLILFLFCAKSEAQYRINGTLGVDLHSIRSSSESLDALGGYPRVDGTRILSNHFISLKNEGFIKSDNFANYSIFTTIKGSFTSTNTGNIKTSSYISPSLNTFGTNISFFPSRSYPLSFFYVKLKDVSLRFNEANRSKTELLSPSLATLQKSRINDEKYGSNFSTNLFKGATFAASYKKTNLQNSYDFDFEENKNIVITSIELPGDIFSPTVPVIFTNNITDDSVRIVSGLINEVIAPGNSATIVFDTGFHFIDIIPLHLHSQTSIGLSMDQGLRFSVSIDAEDFPAQNDNIKESTESNFEFDLKKNKFNLATDYTYEDSFRKNVGLKEVTKTFKNIAKYGLTKKLDISVQTENNNRENLRSESDKQTTNNFKNNTILNFIQKRGLIGSFGHELRKDEVENSDGSKDNTDLIKYVSKLSLPSERFKHNISLNAEIGKQDQTGRTNSVTKSKLVELSNKMEIYLKDIKLVPVSLIKINTRDKTSDTVAIGTDELNISSSLEGSQFDTRILGDVSSKAAYSYTKTTTNDEPQINSTYSWDFMLIKNFSEKHSFSFNTSHSIKYSSDINVDVFDSVSMTLTNLALAVPSQYTNRYSFAYSSNHFENVAFSTIYALSSSPGSQTSNLSFIVDAYVPYLKLPFKTEISNQVRNLDLLPKQTSFKMETSITHRFNQLSLRISHIYSSEKLILDKYKFYEFSVSITRNFGI